MNKSNKLAIKAPGIRQVKPGLFQIRVTRKDQRRAGRRQRDQLFEGTLLEAKRHHAQLVLELESSVEEKAERLTFSLAAKSWLALKLPNLSEATKVNYSSSLDDHILPVLGSLYVDRLRRNDVKAWLNGLQAKGLAQETVAGKLRLFRNLWHDLTEDDERLRDITRKVWDPTEEQDDPDDTNALLPEELGRFLSGWRGLPDEALVNVLAFTGQRFCHCSALHWSDVDFANNRVKMMKTQTRQAVRKANKSKRTPGWCVLPEHVMVMLREHRLRLLREGNPGLPLDIVFPSSTGTYKTPGSLYKTWQKVKKAADIERRFTVHGLRGTFNDMTRLAGASDATTRAMIGHSTAEMTQHYASVTVAEKAAVVGRVLQLVQPTAVAS